MDILQWSLTDILVVGIVILLAVFLLRLLVRSIFRMILTFVLWTILSPFADLLTPHVWPILDRFIDFGEHTALERTVIDFAAPFLMATLIMTLAWSLLTSFTRSIRRQFS